MRAAPPAPMHYVPAVRRGARVTAPAGARTARARWSAVGLLLAVATVLAAAQFVTYSALTAARGGPARSAPAMLGVIVVDYYSWAAVGLGCWAVAARAPLDRLRRARVAAGVLAAGLALLALRYWLAFVVTNVAGWNLVRPSGRQFASLLPFNALLAAGMFGIAYALTYHRRFRDQEVAAARLGEQLAEARLHALKLQLNPHFLFNTLNTIATLMHRDVEAADRVLTRLGDLLRATLASERTHEVSLGRELDALAPYLDIERTRFGDWLAVDVDVPPGVCDALVPHFVLQPLVENAIRHGVAPRGGRGWVGVTAEGRDGALLLRVSDDGVGAPAGAVANARPGPPGAGPREPGGVGLANVRDRLAELYGPAAALALRARPGGGTVAELRLPLRFPPRWTPETPGAGGAG